jgi:hypothetical protein
MNAMSKAEFSPTRSEEFLNFLNDNYGKRIEEVDVFSKRVTGMCAEINTEFLYGYLNLIQRFLDLQKKFYPQYYISSVPDFMKTIVRQNTDAWIQYIQNVDSTCVETMKNIKNNMKALNNNSALFIQSVERTLDIYNKMQSNGESETDQNKSEVVSLKKSSQTLKGD